MAHMTATHADIEQLLGAAVRAWEGLPAVAAEIERWDLLERIDFAEEWSIEEDRLAWLTRYADDGLLTDEQIVRYRELGRLVARSRPIIARLRAS